MRRLCRMAVACVCVLFCGLSLPVSAGAQESTAQLEARMASIMAYSTELSISGDGVATVTGFVRSKPGVSSTYVKVTLQQKVSGVWTDVESWEDSDTRNASVAETYQVSRGTYRVVMTCRADGETKDAASAERTY